MKKTEKARAIIYTIIAAIVIFILTVIITTIQTPAAHEGMRQEVNRRYFRMPEFNVPEIEPQEIPARLYCEYEKAILDRLSALSATIMELDQGFAAILEHIATMPEPDAPKETPNVVVTTIPSIEGNKTPLGAFRLTFYCPCAICCGIWSAQHPSRIGTDFVQRSASGTILTEGRTIAVDTSVIPHGTYVYISRFGWRIAEDTGSAIVGNIIDIFKNCHQTALIYGVQRAYVYILEVVPT